MIGLATHSETQYKTSGLRSVNLRTDLPEILDLLELVFKPSMDASDRAAMRDMRMMSKAVGGFLGSFSGLNEFLIGIRQGFVWVEDGKIVGNVSLLSANWPHRLGIAWQIVNVAVHPDYQRQGIAYQLMEASLKMIREQGGSHAILQVEHKNQPAIALYERLGFTKERAFSVWKRKSVVSAPVAIHHPMIITKESNRKNWKEEYALAQLARPNTRAGMGWLKPIDRNQFQRTFLKDLGTLFSLSSTRRLLAFAKGETRIRAALWSEKNLALPHINLTLINQPEEDPAFMDALLIKALRHHRGSQFLIEHPYDDTPGADLLNAHRFHVQRTRWHMRWTVPGYTWGNLH